jgi:anti-sigma B factor antagonist
MLAEPAAQRRGLAEKQTAMSLSITQREIADVVVLDVTGHSEISDGSLLQETVRRRITEGKLWFVLNLAGTQYLDSFGLGQLVSMFITLRDQNGQMRIVNPNPRVKDLLRYSRVDTVLQVMASEAAAVQDLQQQASV